MEGRAITIARIAGAAGVRPDERRVIALVAAMFLALEAGRGMGDVGAYALVAPEILPYLYIPQGFILLVAALAFGAALGRIARGPLFVAVLIGFAVLVVVEAGAIRAGADAAIPIAWLTVAAAGATAMTIGWTVAASTFDARQAKRLFPLCTAAAIAGYALGSLAGGPLARTLGTESLVVAEGALFVVAALIIGRIAARRPTPAWDAPSAGRRSTLGDVRAGFDEVRGSALLSRIAVAYVLLAILLVAVTVPFWSAATTAFPAEADRAGAVGVITAVVTGVSFLVSLFVANRFYARLGVASAALLLPVVYLIGFAAWTIAFSFATAVAVLAAVQITQRGLSNAAWSAFSTTVPAYRRAEVMIFLDGVPVQIGTILSGILLLTAARVLEPVQVFLAGAGIAAITVIVVAGIRRRYAASLLATLRRGVSEQVLEGGPGLGSLIAAPDVRAVLVVALADADPRVREMAATMLARAPGDDTLDALLAALDDPEPAVRAASAAALVGHDAVHPEHVGRADREITDLLAGGPRERVAGLRALHRLGRRPPEATLDVLLDDRDPAVRAAAIATLDPGDGEAEADAERLLRAIEDPTHRVRNAAADGLARRPELPRTLVERLDAPDTAVQAAAVRAMAGHGSEVRDVLVGWADAQVDRATALTAAGAALTVLPISPDTAFLADIVDGRRRRHQDLALEALAVLEMPEARGVVRRCLRSDDGDVRAQAIEMLDSVGDRRLGRSIARLVEVEVKRAGPAAAGLGDDAITRLRHDDDPWIRAMTARVARSGGEMPDPETGLGDIERMLELRRVPLFERLDPEDLQRVAAVADERSFAPGTTIVREGDVGDELFVILEGRVRVEKLDPDGSTRAIRTYEAGDHFGELAVLLERPRVASVVAESEVRTLVIGGDGLTAILRERPEAAMAMLATLAERISRQ